MKKILLSALLLFNFLLVKTQTPITAPNGEPTVGLAVYQAIFGDPDKVVVVTAKDICVYTVNSSGLPIPPPEICWHISGDVKAVSVKQDLYCHRTLHGINPYFYPIGAIVGLSDGSSFEVLGGPAFGFIDLPPPVSDARTSKSVTGDALYDLTTSNCYRTRDSGRTWVIDTLGFGGGTMNQLDIDSNQRAYLGTTNGLFQQELISNQWNANTHYTGGAAVVVNVDWMQRIWVASYNALYVSSNFGTSFAPAPTGVNSVTAIATDRWGNVFVASFDGKVYRSAGGTAPFVQVDAGIVAQVNEPLGYNAFSSVSADSIVCVGSRYGVFTSADQGATWHLLSEPANVNAGLAKTAAGRLVVSNGNGVHIKDAGSNSWTKTFPAAAGMIGRAEKIFKTTNGHLYTTTQGFQLIWKSVDNGNTWTLDTAGYLPASNVSFHSNSFYVDPNENMHAELVSSAVVQYVRNSGGGWTVDSAGFIPGTPNSAYGTDNNGYLYTANYNGLQKRLMSGGRWQMDTVGLASGVYDLTMDGNGILWAGCYTGLFKRTAGVWHSIQNPPGTSTSVTNSCFVVSVDAANALWTQWSIFDAYSNAIGTGVYFTLDSGSHWTNLHFDTITLKQLISVGDTTYGISYFDGLWQFTRNGSTINIQEEQKGTSQLSLFPNPATNELTLSLSEKTSSARVSITDVTGRKVLENEFNNTQQKTLDISALSRGLYVVEINGKQLHAARKFVKE